MDKDTEEKLWKGAAVQTIEQLDGFPFPNYSAFQEAVKNGSGRIGIEFGPARELAHITKSETGNHIILLLMWIPWLLVIISMILPFVKGNWLLALGVVTAFLGQSLVNPFSPLRGLTIRMSLIAVGFIAYRGTLTTTSTWTMFCFALSCFAIWSMNKLAWNWAHVAIMRSEALAAYFYKTGNLHITDPSGEMHTMQLSKLDTR